MRPRSIVRIAVVLAATTLNPASGRTQQELNSPLPFIAAPPGNAPSSAPVVERLPARLRFGPPRIACWACPSNGKGDCGYYCGGGAFGCRGEPRMIAEGTWGWDYHGCWLPQRVFLRWWHGRCAQGGAGAYRIDGPRVIERLHEFSGHIAPP